MTILSRYLTWQFCRVFLMTFICLFGMSVIGDLVGHFSELVDYKKSHTDLGTLLASYYVARIPWFFELVGRVVCLLSGVFVLSAMQRHNELTAVMAAGGSRWQVARPLCLAAVVIALAGIANRELGIPHFRDLLCRDANDIVRGKPRSMLPRYDNQTNVLFGGTSIVPREQTILEPNIRLPRAWGTFGQSVRAETASFVAGTTEHPPGYLLNHVQNAILLAETPSLVIQGMPLALSPADTPWLEKEQCFILSSLPVEAFLRSKRWEQYSSTRQLLTGIRSGSIDFTPDVRVLLHARFVQPFLDICLFMLGLPFAFSTHRRAVFSSAFKTILLAVGFSGVTIVGKAFGTQELFPAAVAAWLPLIVFAPVAAGFSVRFLQ